MSRFIKLGLCACLAVSAACFEDRIEPLPSAPPAVDADGLATYLVVSNPSPAAGAEVSVAVRALRGANTGVVGSYALKVTFDPAGLEFVGVGRSAHGMVATNPSEGRIVAAGASGDGFTDDELLSITFRAKSAAALQSLALVVSELNSVTFEDKRKALRVERGVFHRAR